MERTQIEAGSRKPATGTAVAALLLAAATTAGCGARRGRLVAWRPAEVRAAAGEADARGARTYRVALPLAEPGARPLRAELTFGAPLDGARLDVVGVGPRPRRALVGGAQTSGDTVVVPLGDGEVAEVEVVLRGSGRAVPPLRAARVATEMSISWPAALGAAPGEAAR